MGEQVYYLWLRFRVLIVAAFLILAVACGVLAAAANQTSEKTSAAPEEDTALDLLVSDAKSPQALSLRERCRTYSTTSEDLHECRRNLPQGLPLLLDPAGEAFLTESGWHSLKDHSIEVDSSVTELLAEADGGFSADLDNDGSLEYGVLVKKAASYNLVVLSLNDLGELYDTTYGRFETNIADVAAAIPWDIDEDGWNDILVVDTKGSFLVLLNSGWRGPGRFLLGNVTIANKAGAVLSDVADWLTTDFNLDGHVDVILVGPGGFGLLVTRLSGQEPPVALPFPLPPGATGVDVVDVNLDENIDIVVSFELVLAAGSETLCLDSNDGRPCVEFPASATDGGVAVLLQDEQGGFSPWKTAVLPNIPYASDVVSSDVDNDGEVEILVTSENPAESGSSLLILHRSYDPEKNVASLIEDTGSGPVGISASRLGVRDLDGDGIAEIILLGRGSTPVAIARGPAETARQLRIRVRGSANLDSNGTEVGAVGAILEIRDVDGTARRIVVGARDLPGLLITLPLPQPTWSGREAIPEVTILFPRTGRRLSLRQVAANTEIIAEEPAS